MSTSSLITLRSLSASESWRWVEGTSTGEIGLGTHKEEEEEEDNATGSAGFMS